MPGLIEVLRRAADAAPERPAVLSDSGSLTYRYAVERSEAVAAGLTRLGVTRFGCVLEEISDVIVCLAASSLVGSEACIYPNYLDTAQWTALAERFGHDVIVTDHRTYESLPNGLPLSQLHDPPNINSASSPDGPVLILTTGTTGLPKGARYEWSRLLGAMRPSDRQAEERWLFAYNANQFGGLQVLIHTLVNHATLVVPASRQPSDVIRSLREYRVTHLSATPTFWRLLLSSLDSSTAADLSLQQITMGGEAVSPSLLARLRGLFPEARISQIYAATEVGTVVSVRDDQAGLPLSVLEREDDASVQLRIVDGELQMRSKVGMLQYHDGEPVSGTWQPTGDLVEVDGDRIRFVGRTTEIINVGGAKVHPLPIEEIVSSVDGVELAVAYGRPNSVTGQIVAVDVIPAKHVDQEALTQEIRERCSILAPAARPRRIRIVSAVEQRGHKLLRQGPGGP